LTADRLITQLEMIDLVEVAAIEESPSGRVVTVRYMDGVLLGRMFPWRADEVARCFFKLDLAPSASE